MFFYISLFIATLIVALVVLWVFHAVADAGRSAYKTLQPGTKNASTSHLRVQRLATTVNETPTPWGWKSHETPANMAKTHAAPPSTKTQWGLSGNENKTRGYSSGKSSSGAKPQVGWPYREEKSELGGRVYKVSRKTRINPGTASKPWGW